MKRQPIHRDHIAWAALLVACTLFTSTQDAFWLSLRNAFTAGFNVEGLQGFSDYLLFAVLSLLGDACTILTIWIVLSVFKKLLRRVAGGASDFHLFIVAGSVIVLGSTAISLVKWRVFTVVGDFLRWGLLTEVIDDDFVAGLESVALELGLNPWIVLIPFALAVLVVLFYRRFKDASVFPRESLRMPSEVRLLGASLIVGIGVGSAVYALESHGSPVPDVLRFKPSVAAITKVCALVSDFDGDGSGLLSIPRDQAPFSGKFHPFALDHPGNGVDENGLAGDLPLDHPVVASIETAVTPGSRSPHLLLIFLEGFRHELLGKTHEGREITPNLNRLAREGTSAQHAFVSSPYTFHSRAQLFGGRIVPEHRQGTIVDDFKERGYHVAHFSGQDDSYAGSEDYIGADRSDHFYDARQDVDARVSRLARPGALQVSWKLLNQRVFEYLDRLQTEDPLFLYVNYTDTHYPYHHAEIDDLLGVVPVRRGKISRDKKDRVLATYDNAAANVDRAIGRLLERWREFVGDGPSAIMITSDHGESLWDSGMLGHGRSLHDSETRIPLILVGFDGDWPEPLALSDLRGLLSRHLSNAGRPGSRARFVPTEREVFHYLGDICAPWVLGVRSFDGYVEFGLRTDGKVKWEYGADGDRLLSETEKREAFEEMIHHWEALVLQNRQVCEEERGSDTQSR